MLRGSRSAIRDGVNTMFWTTVWLDGGSRLLEFSSLDRDDINLEETVADFVDASGNWNISKLETCLNQEGINAVMGMSPPNKDRGEDGWAWGAEPNGKFLIKSAYNLLAGEEAVSRDLQELWTKIWKLRGPNRVKHFLWLAGHDRLLTNEQRVKRNLTTNPDCPLCPGMAESSIHILRDCTFASAVWLEARPSLINEACWSENIVNWLSSQLSTQGSLEFGIICWSLWKARNARAFSSNSDSAKSVAFRAVAWARVVSAAQNRDGRTLGDSTECQRVDIAWEPGPSGWSTINTDGAFDRISGRAAAGGLIRNELGHCTAAFTMNIGCCTIMRAELRGAIAGLRCAWDLGLRKVELQVDSKSVIDLFNDNDTPTHQHAMEVLDFQELCKRDWEIRTRHVFREGNRAADFLAGLGSSYPLGTHPISVTDARLGLHLRYDCLGISEPRLIILND
ncbi:Putative ribonuclease H protein At1g65750 [Linum perenne]